MHSLNILSYITKYSQDFKVIIFYCSNFIGIAYSRTLNESFESWMKEFLMNTDLMTVLSQHYGRNSRKCHDKNKTKTQTGDLNITETKL